MECDIFKELEKLSKSGVHGTRGDNGKKDSERRQRTPLNDFSKCV